MEFLKTKSREEVWNEILKIKPLSKEVLETENALGKVVYSDIYSEEDLPNFRRSLVDGYALRAKDTFGSSLSSPNYLRICGEVKMGEEPKILIREGETVRIWTGGAVPDGSDAVLMLENSKEIGDLLEVRKGVSPGENITFEGEDIKRGDILIKEGSKLRPQDIGALLGVGITSVKVYKTPKIAIVATGDELVEPKTKPSKAQIRDINSYVVEGLLKKEGFYTKRLGIVKDSEEELRKIIEEAEEFDMIVISGGSSKGLGDFTFKVVNSKKPGVLVHGVRISPGKPTIFGMRGEIPIFGLPGHPVSSFVSTFLFVLPAVRKLSGLKEIFPKPTPRILEGDVCSKEGREEWIRVKVQGEKVIPQLSESSAISSLVFSDGLIRIPEEREGLTSGEEVEFFSF